MLDNIGDMSDADKKMLMNLLIEKIEIYPEKQPDGRWIKYGNRHFWADGYYVNTVGLNEATV